MKLEKWTSVFAALALLLAVSLSAGPVLAGSHEKPKGEPQEQMEEQTKEGGEQAEPTGEEKPEEKKE